jgi:hypothetical protein
VTADLLRLRVIGASRPAGHAAPRLAEVFALDRCDGPQPARKQPGQVRYYLTGRLRPASAGSAPTTGGDLIQPVEAMGTVEVCWSGAHGQWWRRVAAGATVHIPTALYAQVEAARDQLDQAAAAVDAWLIANHAQPRRRAAPGARTRRTAE